MTAEKTEKRPARIRFDGRVLFLTEDVSQIRRQLEAGEDLEFDAERTLGEYVYVGMREGAVKKDEVKNGGFAVVVSGLSKGCGSSRETAPFAEKAAGIELVIAKTIEKIYGQNCQNIGLLTSTDFGLIERIRRGEEIPLAEFTRGLDPISQQIVEYGGLFNYNKARLAGEVTPPALETKRRPLNIVEKIIARHAFVRAGRVGVESVEPGDALFAVADVRFSHEYVTPMAESLFKQALGSDARVTEAESVYAFRDHLTFLGRVMPEEKRRMGLLDRANGLATTQESFTDRQGIRLYGGTEERGSEAICHNAVVEDIALPGQLVIGTDSHTCMAGVLGCFAFGVGSTDMANAWYTKDIRIRVPEVVRFVLKGRKRDDVSAKDVMLVILATDYMKEGKGIGQVLEFAGEGISDWPIDERATLTNMAVEAGGFTGIIEPDEVTLEYLKRMRGLSEDEIRKGFLRSDDDAEYAARFEIELSEIRPMVATPGDPRNGIRVSELGEPVRVDIAYGGSCTGGKMADMDMYAAVLKRAVEQGRRVAPGVHLYLQFGSQKIKEYARARGYIELFERAGAELIDPSCGACINAGPGASKSPDQVTVSAQNRNFPGRSGPGKVYLASPFIVAASAIAGRIVEPDEFLRGREEERAVA
ncbi:MAG: 3-isopropylmalate dehydratase [Acidobacteria bacterium]|nr:MAG: 3-isopropylmalate dehydratase [Acidobacteriota bacterium]